MFHAYWSFWYQCHRIVLHYYGFDWQTIAGLIQVLTLISGLLISTVSIEYRPTVATQVENAHRLPSDRRAPTFPRAELELCVSYVYSIRADVILIFTYHSPR